MALLLRHRIQSLLRLNRHFSTTVSPTATSPPDSATPVFSRDKSRAILNLVKSEDNPENILKIIKSAFLNPEFHMDRIVFSVAISKLSQSNNHSYIKHFLTHLRSTRPDLRDSERFATHSIILYGQAGMIEDAILSFHHYHVNVVRNVGNDIGNVARRGSVKAFNALIFAFVLAKEYKELNRVFVEFPKMFNIEPDLQTYNHVTKAFSESGSSSSCYDVLEQMDRNGVKPNDTTFGNMISGFYSEEKYDDVCRVLEIMAKYGVSQGLETYNIRIKSLCKLKRSAEAKGLFDVMVSRNVVPNAETFSHLILGFCVEGNLVEAKRMFNSMVTNGYQPNGHCYFTLVHYLCKDGDFETAFRACNRSLVKGWVPNCATMKCLVNGLAGIGKVHEAKMLVREMKKRFKRNVSQWEEVEAGLTQQGGDISLFHLF
ncbi:pentatricopeptide repeat 336 [Euphorbia peplus]|nr:pentatricopeptide repeat 336 [Euphorbia peplus]